MAALVEKPHFPLPLPLPHPPPNFSNLLSLSTLISDVDNYVSPKIILNHRGDFSVQSYSTLFLVEDYG